MINDGYARIRLTKHGEYTMVSWYRGVEVS